jgi:archaellum component FlaC
VRKLEDRIKQLEEELERTKQDRNAIAKNTREPLLLQLDHANERIKQLEDRIHRASMAFFRDGSDGHVASQMLQILEEERGKP